MKQLTLLVFVFLCLNTGMSSAEDKPPDSTLKSFSNLSLFEHHFGEDNKFGLTIGYKAWMNTWTLPVPFADTDRQPYQQDTTVLFKSETELTSMPTLHLRYKNVYLVTNYFSETKYTFGRQRIDEVQKAPTDSSPLATKYPVEYVPSAERSEWDVSLGYYVNPYIGVTVGYKQIDRNYDYLINYPEITSDDGKPFKRPSEHLYSESQGSGVTLGITGSVPVALDDDLSIYGHFTYGWLNTKVKNIRKVNEVVIPQSKTNTDFSYDNPYYSGEVGFAYALRFKDVTLSTFLGYRFQRYEFRNFTNSGQTARDGTDGIMLSFSATF